MLSPYVYALATDAAGHLFVGGNFYGAGTNFSPFLAQANVGLGVAGGRLGNLAYSPLTGFRCTFRDATVGQPYRIQASPSLVGGSWSDLTNFTYAGPITITDSHGTGTTNCFYRAITP